MKPLYQEIASLVQARQNCIEKQNSEWQANHEEKINQLCCEYMPSGSGIDCGTKIDFDASNPEKLVFNLSFHHMNENGMYDGWTEHQAIVTPSLAFGFNLKFTGKNRNQIKEYLHDIYSSALNSTDI